MAYYVTAGSDRVTVATTEGNESNKSGLLESSYNVYFWTRNENNFYSQPEFESG
jgi:hypothetical protein